MAVSDPSPLSGGAGPVALFAFAYGGAVALGNLLSFDSASLPAFWPASGILLATLLIGPTGHWVRFLAAGFLIQVGIDLLLHDRTLGLALGFGAANGLEAMVGAWLLRRAVGIRTALSEVRHLLPFIGLAAVAAPLLGAMIGATTIAVAAPASAFWPLWASWWMAHALGVLIVAPVILAFATRPPRTFTRPETASQIELVALFLLTAVAVQVTTGTNPADYPLLSQGYYIVLPVLIWAALRFDERHVASVLLLMTLMVVWNTGQERGPFFDPALGAGRRDLALQSFLTVAAITTLMLSAVLCGRNSKEAGLRVTSNGSGALQGGRGTVVGGASEAEAKQRAGRAEQRLLDAIEGISDSFALYDSDQRLVLANQAFQKLHRCQPDEIADRMHRRDLLRLIGDRGAIPEAIGRVEAFVEERMRISEERKVPFEQEFADGRWMLVGEHPTSEGGLVTFHADITDQKATEAALLKRGLELDQAQRIGRIGHWHWDLATGALERSDELFRLIGLNPDGPVPSEEEANNLVHPDDRQAYLARHDGAAARGQPLSIDYRCVLANGETRHFHEESRPQRDDKGVVRSVFGITQDVTEQRLAQATLRDREQRLTMFVEALNSAGFGLSLLDRNYRIVEINRAAVEMAGFADETELLGRRWIELADPEDSDYMAKAALQRDLIARDGLSQVELRWKKHDSQDYLDVVVTAVRAEDDRIVSIFSDVTEQRRVEREQKRLEQELQQSQKMEALGQLAGGTAHEINNLLQPILTFTKLVQDGLSDPTQREHLDRVLDASRKAKAIVRDILLFSRKGPRQLETLDVNTALQDAVRFIRGVTFNSVDFVLRIPDKEAHARINPTEFTQVMMNLVQNAADAMPERSGQITITSRTISLKESQAARLGLGPGRHVRCTVQDDGHGMSPDVLEHVFEPFFTTKPPGRGTGLGLAVVYGIVKSWNGTIRAASSPGAGARFSVYIPILAD